MSSCDCISIGSACVDKGAQTPTSRSTQNRHQQGHLAGESLRRERKDREETTDSDREQRTASIEKKGSEHGQEDRVYRQLGHHRRPRKRSRLISSRQQDSQDKREDRQPGSGIDEMTIANGKEDLES